MTGPRPEQLALPLTLWRISIFHDLRGDGGLFADGRWHSKGHRIVYLAESPSASMLEILARLDLARDEIPASYHLLQIKVPQGTVVEDLSVPAGDAWKEQESATRQIGDAWLSRSVSPLARVPSVIMPNTWNCLLNPTHPQAESIRIADISENWLDRRLIGIRATRR
jgi:RES domain-containing protein